MLKLSRFQKRESELLLIACNAAPTFPNGPRSAVTGGTGVVSKHAEEMKIEVIALRLGFARLKDSVGCKNSHAINESNKADTRIIVRAQGDVE